MNFEDTFGDYASIDSGYAFKSAEWQREGYPVVKIKNIREGVVTLDDCAHISEESAQRARDFKAQGGDILISLTGYVGQVGRVLPGDIVFVNQRVGFVRPKQNSIANYIFYLLQYLKPQIEELGTGTAQANVSPKDIMKLMVPSISKESQIAIGDILAKIDEKIMSNRDLSMNLESIAQSIFKSWFIDFDPVHAKSRGEKPIGMDDETAALFPDSFEESELGMIPKGWIVDPASSLFDFSIGRTPPRKESSWFCSPGLGHTWVSIKDLGTYGVFTQASAENLTAEAIKRHRVPIVPTGTVLMSFKLTLGRIAITSEPLATNEAIAHFIPKEKDSLSSEYTYLFLKNFDYGNLDNTSSIANATNSSQVKNISFLLPSDLILEAFQKRVKPIFIQIDILTRQNRSLEQLRDSLLPRLISGELQIPEDL